MRRLRVIIVGAGPAGSAAAIMLARAGHTVKIFDRRRFPRDHIGESLPPKVEPLLAQLGVRPTVLAAGFSRSEATTIHLGDRMERHPFDPLGRTRGFQVVRRIFDQIVLDQARSEGASFSHGHRVRSLLTTGDRVTGVEVHGERHEADLVIDASGAARLAARQLGLLTRSTVRTLAVTAYFHASRRPTEFHANDTLFEMLPSAWVWSVLRHDGLRNVTIGLDAESVKGGPRGLKAAFQEHLAQSKLLGPLLANADQSRISVVDATTSTTDKAHVPGLLIAGDASAFVDPLTSQGVTKALHSGLASALVVSTVAANETDGEWAYPWYIRSEREVAKRYEEVAARFHAASPFVGERFWQRRVRTDVAPQDSVGRSAAFRTRLAEVGGQRLRLQLADGVGAESVVAAGHDRLLREIGFKKGDDELVTPGIDANVLATVLDGRLAEGVFDGYAEVFGVAPNADLGRRIMTSLMALAEREWLIWRE